MPQRVLALTFVVLAAACQAVTGSFSVGSERQDSGGVGSDGGGAGDAKTGLSDTGAVDDQPNDAPPPSCTCTPQPPAGWTLVVFSSSGASCGGAWAAQPTTLHDGMSAPTPTCGCTCGAPASVSCAIEFENGCPVPVTNLASSNCVETGSQVSFPGGGTYSVSGGTCAPEPTSSVPPLTWTNTLTSCNAAQPFVQGSCSTGDLCAPPVPSGFQLCATQSGDVACPFGTKHTEYTGDDDTRGCSTCTCGSASAVTCGGSIEEFSANNCTGSYTNVSLPIAGGGTCQGSGSSLEYIQSTSGGSCTASGGTATGSAAPTGPITLCCF
jgi:hypothetical protein